MPRISLVSDAATDVDARAAIALPVRTGRAGEASTVLMGGLEEVRSEIEAWLAIEPHDGGPGAITRMARPGRVPRQVLLVGVGCGDDAGWRSAGAALSTVEAREETLTVMARECRDAGALMNLLLGLELGGYTYRLGRVDRSERRFGQVRLVVTDPAAMSATAESAGTIADAVVFARDLTNAPASIKSPAWFADQVTVWSESARTETRVWDEAEIAARGFGGLLAVAGASGYPPRLVELSWAPREASTHVVLIGKGITFDTGGISLKAAHGMHAMRNDMAGAAAVVAATVAAARLGLRVRITALAVLAENAIGAGAMRPGDVIVHYGGQTSEVLNTDAEGRLILADALEYAAAELEPDYLVDLATLTGANAIALGNRCAALYSDNDELAAQLESAARDVGENAWRMPLYEAYLTGFSSELADRSNSSQQGGGSVGSAVWLREFTGTARPRWAHFDMAAPAWTEHAYAECPKGATGWGVRTLVRWLEEIDKRTR